MSQAQTKEYIGDGVYLQKTDYQSLHITAENGIKAYENIWIDSADIPKLVAYIKNHFPIAFAHGAK